MKLSGSVIAVALLLAACSTATPPEDTTSQQSSEGNTGAACVTHADCETPMDYLVRSSCPFTSLCINTRCAVVCPMAFHDPNIDEHDAVQCSADSNCTCEDYAPGDAQRCACVEGACYAVVAE